MSQRGTSRNKKKQLSPRYCEICGYSTVVQQHRIKPGREKGEYVLGNVISLCPNHHFEADHGIIKPKLLIWIVNQRLNGQENPHIGTRQRTLQTEKPRVDASQKPAESGTNGSGDVWDGFIAIPERGFDPYKQWGQ